MLVVDTVMAKGSKCSRRTPSEVQLNWLGRDSKRSSSWARYDWRASAHHPSPRQRGDPAMWAALSERVG